MTQETSDLTVKKEGAIATLDFEADSGRGLENIEKDDLAKSSFSIFSRPLPESASKSRVAIAPSFLTVKSLVSCVMLFVPCYFCFVSLKQVKMFRRQVLIALHSLSVQCFESHRFNFHFL